MYKKNNKINNNKKHEKNDHLVYCFANVNCKLWNFQKLIITQRR